MHHAHHNFTFQLWGLKVETRVKVETREKINKIQTHQCFLFRIVDPSLPTHGVICKLCTNTSHFWVSFQHHWNNCMLHMSNSALEWRWCGDCALLWCIKMHWFTWLSVDLLRFVVWAILMFELIKLSEVVRIFCWRLLRQEEKWHSEMRQPLRSQDYSANLMLKTMMSSKFVNAL